MGAFTLLDRGAPFDGRTPETLPLGGAESAVVSLAETLAMRGHDVTVLNNCAAPLDHRGVRWRPLTRRARAEGFVITNRDPRLVWRAKDKRRAALWLHNDAGYLRKMRYALPLALARPQIVFLSHYHLQTWPFPLRFAPLHVIPLGVDNLFRRSGCPKPPPPRAVFASNPERGLTSLLDIWARHIHPTLPEAELHLYTRADFYGLQSKSSARNEPVMAQAASLKDMNVILHDMVPRAALASSYDSMRAMLYWGDHEHAETFCLSVAEAQAAAVPCVARPVGALSERVAHGKSGYLARDEKAFAEAAISLLRDGDAWSTCRNQATQRAPATWDEAAARFEALHG